MARLYDKRRWRRASRAFLARKTAKAVTDAFDDLVASDQN